MFGQIVQAECLLPKTNSFAVVLDSLEQRKTWKNSIKNLTKKISTYQHQSKLDSLYTYAINYFETKLPQQTICSQIDFIEGGDISFDNKQAKLQFAFFINSNYTTKDDLKIIHSFSYNFNTNKISHQPKSNRAWIPNCNTYPDSCRFINRSYTEVEKFANDLGYKDPIKASLLGGSIFKPTFNLEFRKLVDNDCNMKSLYVNLYNMDTLQSTVFNSTGYCDNLKNNIENADFVVDGTVIYKNSLSINSSIYTYVEIELHHVFKGKINKNTIVAFTGGGDVPGRSSRVFHGVYINETIGSRSLFFLKNSGNHIEKVKAVNELLGKDSFIAVANPPSSKRFELKRWKNTEEKFRLIESLVGQPRKKILHPQTWNQEILKVRKTIPDREIGVIANHNVYNYNKNNGDSVSIYFTLSSTNNFVYLKNWTLELSYNPLAFGSNIADKIKLFKNKYNEEQVSPFYNLKISNIGSNKLKFQWTKKPEIVEYLEFRNHGKKILDFKLAVLNVEEPMNLSLNFEENPVAIDLYDNSINEIEFQFTSKSIIDPFQKYIEPIIEDFYPKTAIIGDTVTVVGSGFDLSPVSLFGESLAGFGRVKSIDDMFIISKTNNKIVFVIPPFLMDEKHKNSFERNNFIPKTGTIYINGATTKEDLIIEVK